MQLEDVYHLCNILDESFAEGGVPLDDVPAAFTKRRYVDAQALQCLDRTASLFWWPNSKPRVSTLRVWHSTVVFLGCAALAHTVVKPVLDSSGQCVHLLATVCAATQPL